MKKVLIIILVLVSIGIAGIAVYSLLSDNISTFDRTLTSDDNKFSMSVPSSWHVTEKARADALFAAENSDSSMYATMRIVPAMPDGFSVDDYINSYMEEIAANSDDPSQQKILSAPAETVYGGNSGYYFELESTADGIPVHLRDFLFVTSDGCVHIDIAATDSGPENAAEIAHAILNSVRYSSEGDVTSLN